MALIYLNGHLVEEADAKISVFDRGFLFSDSIYEVSAVINGQPVHLEHHFDRFLSSCREMEFDKPLSQSDFSNIHQSIIKANDLDEGVIYMQMTRGVAERNFTYENEMRPTVIAFSKALEIVDHPKAKIGLKIKTRQDLRWVRCDIKTTQLTAQSMTKTSVNRDGYDDAWMIKDGFITEGTSNNSFIVDKQGVIITRPLSTDILGGVTRKVIIETARALGYQIEERAFTLDEALMAQEAFSTSTSTVVLPVIEIDGHMIGDGKPGPVAKSLRSSYIQQIVKTK